MLNPSPNAGSTRHVDQHNASNNEVYAGDSDNATSSGSSIRRYHSDNHSLPPFTWNIPRGRPSLQLSSLEDLFQSNPKLSRSRRLDTSLASAVQEGYYSLSEQQTFATTQAFTESDIYSRLMLKRRYGYPLYRPEPLKDLPVEYCRNGVRIGDVGRITPDGAFDFLFNVDSTHASAVNPSTLPCDFETVPPIKFTFDDFFRHGAQIFSDHVVQIKDKHIITYNCSATEGAVLHLPENTILLNAQNKDELYQLAARHAYSWYEYLVINRSQDITNGSLYLVTDCIKTTNWGVGVFNNHKPESDYLEFVSQEQGPGRRYGWRMLGPIVAKVAPTLVLGEANSSERNQCVFLLGFKIALNHGLWRRLQSMAPNRSPTAEKLHQMAPSYSSHSNYSGFTPTSLRGSTLFLPSPIHTRKDSLEVQETLARLEGDPNSTRSQLLQQIFGAICPVHPSDFINVMLLLHEPDANVAIVHDDEWRDLLPNNFAVDPRQLNIKDFLENVAKSRISMTEDGCVSLKWKLSVKWADAPARASSEILPLGSQAELINFSPPEDQARLSPQDPSDNNAFVPTTTTATEHCPRFRILLVGRSGVGKTSLINSIFKTSLPVSHNRAGEANIEREITSSYNEYLVVHDSEGYEPGDPHKLEVVKKFITKRCNATDFTERLHAVWLCITTPYGKGRVLETGDEEICSLKQLGVPVIIVFTKYDLFLDRVKYDLRGKVGRADELITRTQNAAKKRFETECIPDLKKLAERIPGKIPYICISRQHWDSLEKLIQTTLKHISIPRQPQQTQPLLKGIFKKRVGTLDEDHNVSPTEDYSDPRVLVLATAQRIDVKSKLGASISVGKRKYWNGLASGLHFRSNTIWRCLQVVHTDIINVWNIKDMSQYLLSDDFRHRITIIVSDLSPDVPGQQWTSTTLVELLSEAGDRIVSAGPAAVIMAPIAATMALVAWVHEIYNQAPHIIRCFMGYIVDLTVIAQTLFKISAQSSDGNIGITRAEEILHNFAGSQLKQNIHTEIRTFVDGLRTRFDKDLIIEKIDSLIYSNKDAEL